MCISPLINAIEPFVGYIRKPFLCGLRGLSLRSLGSISGYRRLNCWYFCTARSARRAVKPSGSRESTFLARFIGSIPFCRAYIVY